EQFHTQEASGSAYPLHFAGGPVPLDEVVGWLTERSQHQDAQGRSIRRIALWTLVASILAVLVGALGVAVTVWMAFRSPPPKPPEPPPAVQAPSPPAPVAPTPQLRPGGAVMPSIGGRAEPAPPGGLPEPR